MANSLPNLIQQKITLILVVLGLALIIIANSFHFEFYKIQTDHFMAEIGSLLLFIGMLDWFEKQEISARKVTVVASADRGLSQRREAVRKIDSLRERLFAKYGEMPDSVELVREIREGDE